MWRPRLTSLAPHPRKGTGVLCVSPLVDISINQPISLLLCKGLDCPRLSTSASCASAKLLCESVSSQCSSDPSQSSSFSLFHCVSDIIRYIVVFSTLLLR